VTRLRESLVKHITFAFVLKPRKVLEKDNLKQKITYQQVD
jgi:hypothetical protein